MGDEVTIIKPVKIPWFFRGGWASMTAYWASGIPFDILHAVGNFAAALLLAVPMISLLEKLKSGRRE